MGTASSDCLSQQILVFDLSLFNPSGCTQKNEEPNIASNTLTCFSARLGLPPQCRSIRKTRSLRLKKPAASPASPFPKELSQGQRMKDLSPIYRTWMLVGLVRGAKPQASLSR